MMDSAWKWLSSNTMVSKEEEKKIIFDILSELNPFNHYYDSYLHKWMKPNAWSCF